MTLSERLDFCPIGWHDMLILGYLKDRGWDVAHVQEGIGDLYDAMGFGEQIEAQLLQDEGYFGFLEWFFDKVHNGYIKYKRGFIGDSPLTDMALAIVLYFSDEEIMKDLALLYDFMREFLWANDMWL